MTEQKNIEFSRNLWGYSLHLVVVLGIIAITILLSRLYSNPFFLGLVIVLFLIIVLLLILAWVITITGDYAVNSLKNQQFPHDLNSANQDHDALIMIHSMGNNFTSYPGFNLLIRFFISQQYPFKIYHCYNPEDFQNILKNEKTKYLWIFGHGWRGGISFKWTRNLSHLFTPNKTAFSYVRIQNELQDYPRKRFIGQSHCNHERKDADNTSLPEILLDISNDSKYYVSAWKMNPISIWFIVKTLVTNVRRTPIPNDVIEDDQNVTGCC
jgi:hypothetical protein